MDLTFRLAGAWGPGKGANLQPSEVDNNFWSIAQAIVELQNDPAVPNGIASISVSGTEMTITLTDGTVMGPFTLPVLTFRWRGEWQPETAYAELDVVTVTAVGIFMVLVDHTSDVTFDGAFMVDGLAAYLQLFGSTDASLSALPDVNLTDVQVDDILVWDGTDWVNTAIGTMAYQDADDVSITGGAITGMPTPVNPADVATKGYVDSLPAGATAASLTMMSNITGGTAPAIPNTLTDYLDTVLGLPPRGTLLYRAGPGWFGLAPGAEGQFLQTHDAGADPTWAPGGSGVTSITAGAGIDTTPDTIVATGSIALAAVADNALLANISGSSAAPSATTLSAFLDHVVSTARGTILTRTTGGWVALAPGLLGQYLKSLGSGADLVWDSPAGSGTVTSVGSGTGLTGGPITGAGTLALASIANSSVLANISGSTAAPVPATVSALFDSVFGATQGAVLYRNASTWVVLAPGTSGQVLTTAGTAANPSWANAPASPAIATARILANISGSTAVPIANTLSNIFNSILGSSRGMIVYRGSAGWAALAAGTSGQVLTTGGTAGDPHWAAGGGGGGASITISDTAPVGPSAGALWWDSVGGQLYLWYNDGTSSQWVPSANQPGPTGPPGSANMSGMIAGQIPIAATPTTVTSSTASLAASFMPAYTGDVTSPAGSAVNTLVTVPVSKGGTNKTSWTAGSVTFAASTTALGEDNANLAWDNTNKRLGVGTASPGGKLQVAGADSTTTLLVTGSALGIRVGISGGGGTIEGVDNAGGASYQPLNVGGSGVNITVSGVTQAAAGTGFIVGSPTGGGLGLGKLNAVEVRANNVVLTSSIDLKTAVEPITRALPLVDAIQPKTFRWQPLPDTEQQAIDGKITKIPSTEPDFTTRLNRGFIAQEVAQALGGDPQDGVDLGGLVAILWQAVRELRAEVAALEAR